jgi:ribosome-binding ATPase YchF (GTP1/OBG family)
MNSWDEDDMKDLASQIIKKSKKMIIAANKADIAPEANVIKLRELELEKESKEEEEAAVVIPSSAEAELALRTAAKHEFIKYLPGDTDFEIAQVWKC